MRGNPHRLEIARRALDRLEEEWIQRLDRFEAALLDDETGRPDRDADLEHEGPAASKPHPGVRVRRSRPAGLAALVGTEPVRTVVGASRVTR